MRMYESKDIQALAGVSKIQLIHWTQIGAIIPYKDERGRGKRRTYSQQNLIETMICRELNKLCVETRVMRELLDWLREHRFVFVLLNEDSFKKLATQFIHGTGTFGYRLEQNEVPFYTEEYQPVYPEGKITSTLWKFLNRHPRICIEHKKRNTLSITISRKSGGSSRSVEDIDFNLRPMYGNLIHSEHVPSDYDEVEDRYLPEYIDSGYVMGDIEDTCGMLFVHLWKVLEEAGGI